MNNKGFTLMELLAVIVILSLLALIANNTVTNVVRDSKSDLYDTQIEAIRLAAEAWGSENLDKLPDDGKCKYLTLENLKDYGILDSEVINPKTNVAFDNNLKIKISSSLTDNGVLNTTYEVDSNDVSLCKNVYPIPYQESENISIPNLLNDTLTPVIYNGENWIVADVEKKWYSYENQEWANAVILDSSVNKKVGDIVTVDGTNPDALAMFVWIPRYEYKIDGTYGKGGTSAELPGEIEINFINTSKKEATTNYIIHPAFTFKNTISGIWVGKFEVSHTTLSASTVHNNLGCSTKQCEIADGLRILPNVASLRYNNNSNFFYAIRSMERSGNAFGIDSSITDSHMMKNSEWGAVAYLLQSKYGKYGNTNYTGANKEIYQNKSSGYITGSSNGTPSSETTNTQCAYNDTTNNCGIGASTTGNIYGIYDMSGGTYEYVMGVFANSNGQVWSGYDSSENSGFDGKVGNSGTDYDGVQFPTSEYYDVYKASSGITISSETACNEGICYGYALSETTSWYGDYASFVSSSYPWFARGGYNSNGTESGVFGSNSGYGSFSYYHSTRVVLVPTR